MRCCLNLIIISFPQVKINTKLYISLKFHFYKGKLLTIGNYGSIIFKAKNNKRTSKNGSSELIDQVCKKI